MSNIWLIEIFRVHHDATVCYAQIAKPLKLPCGDEIKLVNQSAMHAGSTTSCTTSIDRLLWKKTPFKWVELFECFFALKSGKKNIWKVFFFKAFDAFWSGKLLRCFLFLTRLNFFIIQNYNKFSFFSSDTKTQTKG